MKEAIAPIIELSNRYFKPDGQTGSMPIATREELIRAIKETIENVRGKE